MSTDISDIWSYPKGGAVPDLTPQLEALDMAALFAVSGPLQDRALAAVDAERDHAASDATADLKTKGIHMYVDRMMRGSLVEWAQIWWGDLMFNWRNRGGSRPDPVPDDALLVFNLPLALTYPRSTLTAEYDAIDAEVSRMTEGLSRQITVSRGRDGLAVHVPDKVLENLEETEFDDWSEDQVALCEAGNFTAYWPPVADAPAMALSVVQEDAGHVIEVKLMARGAAAHRRFVGLLADHGSSLNERRGD